MTALANRFTGSAVNVAIISPAGTTRRTLACPSLRPAMFTPSGRAATVERARFALIPIPGRAEYARQALPHGGICAGQSLCGEMADSTGRYRSPGVGTPIARGPTVAGELPASPANFPQAPSEASPRSQPGATTVHQDRAVTAAPADSGLEIDHHGSPAVLASNTPAPETPACTAPKATEHPS